jgi:cytochrome c peroxidase
MLNRRIILKTAAVVVAIIFLSGTIFPGAALAIIVVPPPGLFQHPLNQVVVPEPPNLLDFVRDKDAAIRLGKAFFWDMQTGSNGIQACASCHFHAGADNRVKNTVNPGTRAGDNTFQIANPNDLVLPTTSFSVQPAPGVQTNFPLHLRDNPDFQASNIVRDSNDVVGSQGVTMTDFVSINTGSAIDNGTPVLDPVFNVGGTISGNTQRVTARNTPTVINAVFNFNNFWDGRAHFAFNGSNPFGPLDPNAGVYFPDGAGGLVKQKVSIEMGSLASQATGPPLDDTEMSYKGRTFPELGRKMLSLRPLGKQLVHPADSVLGLISRAVQDPFTNKVTGLPGLKDPFTYEKMINDAFVASLVSTTMTTSIITRGTPTTFTQMEANFSLFWGLAIQLYEATLVSGQTRFDRLLGGDQNALNDAEKDGFLTFFGNGRCNLCHGGTELTNGSVTASAFVTNTDHALIEQMPVASGLSIIYDAGFNNTAVRPTTEDIGRGGGSPFTNPLTSLPFPLSFSELAELQAAGNLPFSTPILQAALPPTFPLGTKGNFKVPGLRNVELTAPYFHNGDSRTLEEVVDFYTRGGNFPAANINELDINILQIGQMQNNPTKQANLVAFMKSMTDNRVKNESAPFDHPELFIPNGDNPGPDGLTRIPARDNAGNIAPPFALTLNPLPVRTNSASLVANGTKEGSTTTVSITVNNGPAIPATAAAATTWSAPIDLAPGLNNIVVTATDAVGSVTLEAAVTRVISDGSLLGTGPVTIADALRALHIAVGVITPTADDLIRGDVAPQVNGVPAPDGRIGVDDALLILKKAAGLINF